jgi:hypothetical protein
MLGQQGFGDEHILGFEGALGYDPLAFFEEVWQDALIVDYHFLMVIRDGKDHMGFGDMVADGSFQGTLFYQASQAHFLVQGQSLVMDFLGRIVKHYGIIKRPQ